MNEATQAIMDAIDLHHHSLVETVAALGEDDIERSGGMDALGDYISVYQGVLAAMRYGAMLGSFCEGGEVDASVGTKLFVFKKVMKTHLALTEFIGNTHVAETFEKYLSDVDQQVERYYKDDDGGIAEALESLIKLLDKVADSEHAPVASSDSPGGGANDGAPDDILEMLREKKEEERKDD